MIEAREVYLKGIEGNTRLHGCSVSARSGEAVAVVGQRGSGKSTLLQVLAGVLVPDKGVVQFQGNTSSLRGRTAFLGDFLSGPYHLSGHQWLEFWLDAAKALKPGNRERVSRELERFSCGFVEAPVEYCSRTEGRILDFIRVAALDTPVLLLDAPDAGLWGSDYRALVASLEVQKGEGRTIVMTVDRPELAIRLCDRVLYMADGRVVAESARGETDFADKLTREMGWSA